MIVYLIGMAAAATATIIFGLRLVHRRWRSRLLDILVVLVGLAVGVFWPFVLLFGVPLALVGVPIWLVMRRRRRNRTGTVTVATSSAQLAGAAQKEARRAEELGLSQSAAVWRKPGKSHGVGTAELGQRYASARGGRPVQQLPVWIPAGGTVQIGRYVVSGGMVYVGVVPRHVVGTHQLVECIDPSLEIDYHRPDPSGRGITGWPAYHSIPPACRSGYLSWLADGRRAPGVHIGYVFLYFYGLERRVLVDARTDPAARSELPRIFTEVTRLLQTYRPNDSFRSYATAFQQWLSALLSQQHGSAAATPPDPATTPRFPTPLPLQVGIGSFARDARPVPGEWAHSWAMLHPEIYPRTPATRCPEEFRRLFLLRYQQAHREGLVVHPLKRRLSFSYQPASPSLTATDLTLDFPDVITDAALTRQLGELVESCTTELDAYSRLIGRKPEAAGSLPAVALLPAELLDDDLPALRPLREVIGRRLGVSPGPAVIDSGELTALWPSRTPGTFAKADSVALAQLLERLGVGVEPDIRMGGPVLGTGPAVLFRTAHAQPTVASPEYAAATTLLHLAAVVSAADKDVSEAERQQLLEHLESSLHLSAGERERLIAHLAWLLASDSTLTGLKKRLAALTPTQRRQAAGFLTTVAAIDGQISASEVDTLRKIYTLLELDPESMYGQLHATAAGGPRSTTTPLPTPEPITVRGAQPGPSGYRIPPPAGKASPDTPPSGLVLDQDLIEARLAESAAVSALLADLFADDAEDGPDTVTSGSRPDPIPSDIALVNGLDAAHSALVHRLAGRLTWTRAELEDLCAELHLMPEGALDTVNEAAMDAAGEPFVEDSESDGFDINAYAQGELLG